MGVLTLKIVSHDKVREPISCDSVHLPVCDNAEGKGGGSYGIRPGHVHALFALEEGMIKAYVKGEEVLSARCGGGFATVEKDLVTVVIDSYQ